MTFITSAISVKHEGDICWDECEQKEGKCKFCGTGLCCRKSDDVRHWATGGCDGTHGGEGKHICIYGEEENEEVTRSKFKEATMHLPRDGFWEVPIKGTYFFLFTCASDSKRLDVMMVRTSTEKDAVVAMTSIGEENHPKNIVSSLWPNPDLESAFSTRKYHLN